MWVHLVAITVGTICSWGFSGVVLSAYHKYCCGTPLLAYHGNPNCHIVLLAPVFLVILLF